MTTLPLSPAYRAAVKVTLAIQVVAALILLIILDGGTLAKVGGAATAGFWVGAAVVMFRRPRHPSRLDLLYVQWGFIPLLVVGVVCAPFVSTLRG
jgi:hypothetical protein